MQAWTRDTIAPDDWTVRLPPPALAELRAVLEEIRRAPVPTFLLDAGDFALDACRATMNEVRRVTRDGPRFAVLDRLPPEYRHEPRMALAAGDDGLDLIRRILADAPRHLTRNGALLCELGRGRRPLERAYPSLPFLWLDTEQSQGEVFWIAGNDL